MDLRYKEVQFDGRFVKENVYRKMAPSPETDEAWDKLGIGYNQVRLPEALAVKAGITRNHTRIKAKYGGGYPVFVEGLHQLHCLNLVRKSLWYNYEHYHGAHEVEFSDSDKVIYWHVSHCLDIIRQRLMCTMDTSVFGSVWVDRNDPRPFTDFNTKHVCRDFEQIREWAEDHQLGDDTPEDFLELPGEDVYVWDVAP
ncbi:uncharacterized protein PV09_01919 [Verruconis gallopava]|uniref:Uncharacterized protein n=1 Tax=Verruconis gallopava TaxID=253628 RepID=A0A0D2AKF2_9PEZI|nr:uncharacterized protein PV09_01919 [Verruconis gallopava]KIW07025.1 hypothetical protein PV09_01919 [Verruconis gallopava]